MKRGYCTIGRFGLDRNSSHPRTEIGSAGSFGPGGDLARPALGPNGCGKKFTRGTAV